MDAVSEVKNRLSIEDVVSEYVNLKRSGRNWKGLSPFTSEKTPSLIVSPEKQIWKDFSSGKGGSVIDFIMEAEGLDFKEALELLAEKAGVELDKKENRRSGINKERLYEILELSTKFYQTQLKNNKQALAYVKNRQFSRDTVVTWRLGYSPNTGTALNDYLKHKGFSEQEIKQTGLVTSSYRGLNDMFRERLMIPLMDPAGRVIGFTARLLSENKNAPKYINTPQTILYDKSQHVYGYHLAKETIRKDNYVVMVEGNLDVIASFQAGVHQTVATAGTALTLKQLKLLSRLTTDIRLAFDSDRAGLAATERAIPIASKAKVNLSVIDIPLGKDPDEVIKTNVKLWHEAVAKPAYALDWLIDRYKKLLDIKSAKGKKEFTDILIAILKNLEDPIELDHYLNLIAKEIEVSKDALLIKFNQGSDLKDSAVKKSIHANQVVVDKHLEEFIKIQDKFLCLMLERPTLRELIGGTLSGEMLPTSSGKELFKLLRDNKTTVVSKLKIMKNIEDYVKIEALLYEELYQGLELNELHDEATRLQADLITKYVKHEKEKISLNLKQSASDADIRSMQEKDKQLNLLLKNIRGEVNA